ncbi:MAG: hypothetical protein BGO90_10810 [Legionella sp. 40-6]|nr:MFS transporter [Legionella sp.]OJY46812.1 MAG: hypothetical protein BGO90_10810 [Legionella sp. 40-6]
MAYLYLIIFFITLGTGIISPLIAPMLFTENGFFAASVTHEQRVYAYALIMGVYAVGMIFSHLLWGFIADRIGGKKAIIWALSGSLLGYILCCISFIYALFFLFLWGRLLDGFMAGRRSVAIALLAQQGQNSSHVFRYAEIANGMGLLIGPAVSGLLINFSRPVPLYYYALPLAIMALIMITNISLIAWAPLKNSVPERKKHMKFDLSGSLLKLYLQFFMIQLSWYGYFLVLTPLVILRWQFTPLQVGLFFSGMVLFYIFALGIIVPACREFALKNLLTGALLVTGFSLLFMFYTSEIFWKFLIGNIGVITGMAFLNPGYMAQITAQTDSAHRGKVVGIQSGLIGFAWLCASLMLASGISVLSGQIFLWASLLLLILGVLRFIKLIN